MQSSKDLSAPNKKAQIMSKSEIYADVFMNNSSACDYKSFVPETDDIDNYSLVQKLGQGKYSNVFEGIYEPKKNKVVIKILKPVRETKFKREIKVLELLRGGYNIIKLLTVVTTKSSFPTALVFEHMDCVNFKSIYDGLSEPDMKHYMYEILKTLDFCHSKGVMHRDIKPVNIIVKMSTKEIRLIDWGLADFYVPFHEYNVRVASRFFKAPELLVDYQYYNYSLDLWSLGCMFATMLFKKEPFFHGCDNQDQLVKIVKVLGTADFNSYLEKYNITLDRRLQELIGNWKKTTWERYISSEYEYLASETAIDLLNSFLKYDHMERITAKQALSHKYFAGLHKQSFPGKSS